MSKGENKNAELYSSNGSSDDEPEVEDKDEDKDPIEYMKSLFDISILTFKQYEKEYGKKCKGKMNPVLLAAINYKKITDRSEFSDHITPIKNMYNKNKQLILSYDDSWLTMNDISICFDEKAKTKRERDKYKLYIGNIYNKASELYEKKIAEIEGLKEEDKPTSRHRWLIMPTEIMRYIYLMFLEIADKSKEKEKLGDILNTINEALGINDGTYEESLKDNGEGLFGGGGINKIMAAIMGSIKKNGFDVPEGVENIDTNNIADTIQSFFSGDNAMMKDIIDSITNCKDQKDILGVLTSKLKDEELLKEINKATGLDLNADSFNSAMSDEGMLSKLGEVIGSSSPLEITEGKPFEILE
jgi:hypothetical protein